MKVKIILIIFCIAAGILFTFYFLNSENFYAKEEYSVFAFQTGAFSKYDNAIKHSDMLPSSIILKEDNLYKVYVAMYKDIDLVNKMLVYFEDNNINIFLKSVNIDKMLNEKLVNFEKLLMRTNEESVYNKINQSILDSYLESINNEKVN